MPRLKKRPDGRYQVKYKGRYFYGDTQKEANEKRDEYVAQEKSGLLTADIGFRAYAARWISAYKSDVAQKTYAQYARYLNDAADQLGDPQIASVTPTHIQILFRSLSGKSASYIAKYTSTIRSVMQAAYRDGFISRDPTVGLHRPAGTSGTHRALEPWEDDILFQLQDHRLGPAVFVMRYAGLRRGEACYLDIDRDVDFQANTITVRGAVAFDDENQPTITGGKTAAAQRVVPLLDPVANCLRGRHGLLISKTDGGLITQSAFKRAWESWKADFEQEVNGTKRGYFDRRVDRYRLQGVPAAKLPKWIPCTIRTHDFRHSFVSDLYAAGIDIKLAMEWVGHTDMAMIMEIYAHLQADTKKAAEESLRQMLNARLAPKAADLPS